MTDVTFAIVSVTCALLARTVVAESPQSPRARVQGLVPDLAYVAAVAFVIVAVLNTLGVI